MPFKKALSLVMAFSLVLASSAFAGVDNSAASASLEERALSELPKLSAALKAEGAEMLDERGHVVNDVTAFFYQMARTGMTETSIRIPGNKTNSGKPVTLTLKIAHVNAARASVRMSVVARDSEGGVVTRRSITLDPNADFSANQIAISQIAQDLKSAIGRNQVGFMEKAFSWVLPQAYAGKLGILGNLGLFWVVIGVAIGKPSPWMIGAGAWMIFVDAILIG